MFVPSTEWMPERQYVLKYIYLIESVNARSAKPIPFTFFKYMSRTLDRCLFTFLSVFLKMLEYLYHIYV